MPDTESQDMMRTLVEATRQLIPYRLVINQVGSKEELIQKITAEQADVLFLDWQIAGSATPDLTCQLAQLNPKLRIIILLPFQIRQYQQYLLGTGVCSCLPKDRLDQEWLCTILCLIYQGMQYERHLIGGD